MGSRGPSKKPAAEHKRRGTYRKDRHAGPVLPVSAPPMPGDLSPAAQACWHVVAMDLQRSGVLSQIDGLGLRLLCESFALYLDASDAVLKFGVVIEEKTAAKLVRYRANPAVRIRNAAWNEIVAMLRQFGLTPAARTGLQTKPIIPGHSDDERVRKILKLRPA